MVSPFLKGNVAVGTRPGVGELAGGSTLDGKSGISYHVSLAPAARYFIRDNVLLFASVNCGVSGMTYGANYSSKFAGVGVGARYYFGRSLNPKAEVNRFRFYAEAGGSLSQGWAAVLPAQTNAGCIHTHTRIRSHPRPPTSCGDGPTHCK